MLWVGPSTNACCRFIFDSSHKTLNHRDNPVISYSMTEKKLANLSLMANTRLYFTFQVGSLWCCG